MQHNPFKRPLILVLSVFILTTFVIPSCNVFAVDNVVETTFFGNLQDDGEGCGVYTILNSAIDILSIGIGILAIIGITITGIKYLTAKGDIEQTKKAKRRLLEIVIGLMAYVLLYAGVQWLLPGGKLNTNQSCSTISDTELAKMKEAEKKEKEKKETAKKAKNDSKSNNAKKGEIDKYGTTANGQKILDAAEWTARRFDGKGYNYYYVEGQEQHFGWQVAERDKQSHCSSYVTLVTKKAGLLPENKKYASKTPKNVSNDDSKNKYRIWCDGGLQFKPATKKYIKDYFKIKRNNQNYINIKDAVKSKALVPGDIFCPRKHHIVIYGGKKTKGKNKGKYIIWEVYQGKLTLKRIKNYYGGSYKVGEILHAK